MLLRVKKKIILVYLCMLILLKDPVLLYRKPYLISIILAQTLTLY